MNKKNIATAATTAVNNSEDIQLWQAAIWMEDYGLITHAQLVEIEKALTAARKSA